MTHQNKALLQAKHRLEEAQARDRVKERKARNHRLIVNGATLERVFPQLVTMDTEEMERFLRNLADR